MGATSTDAFVAPPRSRGRPALCWWSLDEVAAELQNPLLTAEVLQALLDTVPGAMPGAEIHETHGWIVPSSTVRALRKPRKGLELIQEATIEEVCIAMRKSKSVVHRWCTEKGPNGKTRVRARMVDGEWLIDVKSLYEMPAKCPPWAVSAFLKSRSQQKAQREEEAAA